MSKKILSVILSVAMLIGLVPFVLTTTAAADDYVTTYYYTSPAHAQAGEDGSQSKPFSSMDALIDAVNASGNDVAGKKIQVLVRNDTENWEYNIAGKTFNWNDDSMNNTAQYIPSDGKSYKATLVFNIWDKRGDGLRAFMAYNSTKRAGKDMKLVGPTEFHNIRFVDGSWGGSPAGLTTKLDTNGYSCVIDNCIMAYYSNTPYRGYLFVSVGASNTVKLEGKQKLCNAYAGSSWGAVRNAAGDGLKETPTYSGYESLDLTGKAGTYAIDLITAEFKLSAVSGEHYTVTVPDKVTCGETVNVVVDTDKGYELSGVQVNGEAITGTSFIMPAKDVKVTATVVQGTPLEEDEAGYVGYYYMAYYNADAAEKDGYFEDGTQDHPFTNMDALIKAVNASGKDKSGYKIWVGVKNDDYNNALSALRPEGKYAGKDTGSLPYDHDASLSHKVTLSFHEWDKRGDHQYGTIAYEKTCLQGYGMVLAGPTEFTNIRFIVTNWDWEFGVGGCKGWIDSNNYSLTLNKCLIAGFSGQKEKTFLFVKVGDTNEVTIKSAGLACKAYATKGGTGVMKMRDAGQDPTYEEVDALSLKGKPGIYGIVCEPAFVKLEDLEDTDVEPEKDTTVLTPDADGFVATYYMKYREKPNPETEDGSEDYPFSTFDNLIKAINKSGKDVAGYKIKVAISNEDQNVLWNNKRLSDGARYDTPTIYLEHDQSLTHNVTLYVTTWDSLENGRQAELAYTKSNFPDNPRPAITGPMEFYDLHFIDGTYEWTHNTEFGGITANGYDLKISGCLFTGMHPQKFAGRKILLSKKVTENKIYTVFDNETVELSQMNADLYVAEFEEAFFGFTRYKKNLNLVANHASFNGNVLGIASTFVPSGRKGIVVNGALQVVLNGGASLNEESAKLSDYVFADDNFKTPAAVYVLKNASHENLVYVTEETGVFKVDTQYTAVATSEDQKTVVYAVDGKLDLSGKPGTYTITWTDAPTDEGEEEGEEDISSLNITNSMYVYDFHNIDGSDCACNLGIWYPTSEQQGDDKILRITCDYYLSARNGFSFMDMTGHGVGNYTDESVYGDNGDTALTAGRGQFAGTFYGVGSKFSLTVYGPSKGFNGPSGRLYIWNLKITDGEGNEVPIGEAKPNNGKVFNGHGDTSCDCYYEFLSLGSEEAKGVIALTDGTFRTGEEPTEEDDEDEDSEDESAEKTDNPDDPFANALMDWDTGVEVAYKDGSVFADMISLDVYHLPVEEISEELDDMMDGRWYEVYDVNLIVFETTKTQPASTLLIHLPIPDDFIRTHCAVYYYDEEEGELVNMNAKLAGEYVEFETDHLSTYVLVQEDEEVIDEDYGYGDDDEDENPETGDAATGIACAVILLLLAAAVLTVSKKRLA